jgi:exopolyphosphatase/guanosine-5'-triphosphate,3'-diphosphate pyrophosphatase
MDPSSDSVGPDLRVTIHIGASTVSMLVAEPDSEEGPGAQIEFLEKPLPLARDIFRRGQVSRATTEHAVEILLGFQESLREAGTDFSQVERAVVTNILAEAENVEVFQNRLDIACGLHLEVLDDGEMTRLIYLKTRRRLRDTPSMQKRNTASTATPATALAPIAPAKRWRPLTPMAPPCADSFASRSPVK